MWIACQEPDLKSIEDHFQDKDTLKKVVEVVDKNGMNIFHVLLFDQENEPWYTKELETKTRKNVVQFIEAICQRIGEENIIEEIEENQTKNRVSESQEKIAKDFFKNKILRSYPKEFWTKFRHFDI